MNQAAQAQILKAHVMNIVLGIHLPIVREFDTFLGCHASASTYRFDYSPSGKEHALLADCDIFKSAIGHLFEMRGFCNKGSHFIYTTYEVAGGKKPEDVLGEKGFTLDLGNSLSDLHNLTVRMHPSHSVAKILAQCTEEQVNAAVARAIAKPAQKPGAFQKPELVLT